MIESSPNPPLLDKYTQLLCHSGVNGQKNEVVMEECELPLIDLGGLRSGNEEERLACAAAISKASSEWGFFQLVNHGIDLELLRKMRREQIKLFEAPFERKTTCGLFNNSYRWGNHTATTPKQLSWSEAFHVPLTKISEEARYEEFSSLREVMEEYASEMQKLAKLLARVIVTNLGHNRGVLDDICDESTCFLRLNRYPVCPIAPRYLVLCHILIVIFLTILHQDEVGGLQLMKDSKWVAVIPNQDALIVNIGDLFQAWSNDVYKSVEHKVMVNAKVERYSIAYFLCPSYDSLIGSCKEPSVYKNLHSENTEAKFNRMLKRRDTKWVFPDFSL